MTQSVAFNDITVTYGKKAVLKHINIEIKQNRIIGLVGKNSAGKTTLLQTIAGQIMPQKGELNVLGGNPIQDLGVRKQIIYSCDSVFHKENNKLSILMDFYEMTFPNFNRTLAEKLMVFFQLNPVDKYKTLSKGRVSLFNFICAIATRAELTLFDEPVVGMDITTRKKVYEIILRDYMEFPRTIIISSHILGELENILSEIIMIDHGEIVLYEEIDTLKEMAYRVDGDRETVKEFINEKCIIYNSYSTLENFAIIKEAFTDDVKSSAMGMGLTISKVTVEELYVYLTDKKEKELSYLWE